MFDPIQSVQVHIITCPLDEPFAFSQGWAERRSSVLVEITTKSGLVGWGECLCHGLQHPALAAGIIREAYAPRLVGRYPHEAEVIWEELYNLTRPYGQGGLVINALSGVDIALWDLQGKILQRPVHQLLGGAFRTSVEPYVTGFYRRRTGNYPRDGIEEAQRWVAEGYHALKLKTGFGPDEDIAYFQAVRAALGPDIRLMMDANCAYSVEAARRVLQGTEECDVFFFEEPLAPENIEGYRMLRNLTRTSLAAGENVLGKHAIRNWIVQGALDTVQPDICSSGGFTELKKIAALCQCWHTTLYPHVWGSGICLAASLQFIATVPANPLCLQTIDPLLEYDRSEHPFRSELIGGAITRDQAGRVPVPMTPGLGVEVDRKVLARYSTQ